jgi:hypothetical protein
MSGPEWFVAGWLSGCVFIAVGLWLHFRSERARQAATEVPDTTDILADYQGAVR